MVLRLETMPRTLVKLIYNSIKLAIFVSAVSLILLFVAKMVRTDMSSSTCLTSCVSRLTYHNIHNDAQVDPNFGFYDLWFTWVQLAFASVFMVVGAYIWGEFVYRLLAVRKRRLEWCGIASIACPAHAVPATCLLQQEHTSASFEL